MSDPTIQAPLSAVEGFTCGTCKQFKLGKPARNNVLGKCCSECAEKIEAKRRAGVAAYHELRREEKEKEAKRKEQEEKSKAELHKGQESVMLHALVDEVNRLRALVTPLAIKKGPVAGEQLPSIPERVAVKTPPPKPVEDKCKWCGAPPAKWKGVGAICEDCHRNRMWINKCMRYSDALEKHVARHAGEAAVIRAGKKVGESALLTEIKAEPDALDTLRTIVKDNGAVKVKPGRKIDPNSQRQRKLRERGKSQQGFKEDQRLRAIMTELSYLLKGKSKEQQ